MGPTRVVFCSFDYVPDYESEDELLSDQEMLPLIALQSLLPNRSGISIRDLDGG